MGPHGRVDRWSLRRIAIVVLAIGAAATWTGEASAAQAFLARTLSKFHPNGLVLYVKADAPMSFVAFTLNGNGQYKIDTQHLQPESPDCVGDANKPDYFSCSVYPQDDTWVVAFETEKRVPANVGGTVRIHYQDQPVDQTVTADGPDNSANEPLTEEEKTELINERSEVNKFLISECGYEGYGDASDRLSFERVLGGGELFAGLLPCGNHLARYNDLGRLINDPPDDRFAEVALPAAFTPGKRGRCRRKDPPACKRLMAAATGVGTTQARVSSVYDMLATAGDRYGAARAANNVDGMLLQNAVVQAGFGELVAASTASDRAGGKFAKEMKRAGVRAVIKPAGARAVVASLAKKLSQPTKALLASYGVVLSDILPELKRAAAKITRPIDTVALLSQKSDLTLARSEHAQITIDGVRAIVTALQLPDATRTTLTKDLDDAAGKTAQDQRAAAIRTFITDANAVVGEPGLLLRTAAEPLAG